MMDAARQTQETEVQFEGITGDDSKSCYCSSLGAYESDLPPSLCKDWDSGRSVKFRVGEKQEGNGPDPVSAGWKFLEEYPVSYGDGMYTHGEFVEIRPEQSKSFIQKIRWKYHINRVFYFFSEHYFDLEPMI
jgi:hypothetical protein